MSKETGGPAFPGMVRKNMAMKDSLPVYDDEPYPGMTLRDYFAIHAGEEDVRFYRLCESGEQVRPEVARYAFADAMISQRKKE
jgi:hypothetical protein